MAKSDKIHSFFRRTLTFVSFFANFWLSISVCEHLVSLTVLVLNFSVYSKFAQLTFRRQSVHLLFFKYFIFTISVTWHSKVLIFITLSLVDYKGIWLNIFLEVPTNFHKCPCKTGIVFTDPVVSLHIYNIFFFATHLTWSLGSLSRTYYCPFSPLW